MSLHCLNNHKHCNKFLEHYFCILPMLCGGQVPCLPYLTRKSRHLGDYLYFSSTWQIVKEGMKKKNERKGIHGNRKTFICLIFTAWISFSLLWQNTWYRPLMKERKKSSVLGAQNQTAWFRLWLWQGAHSRWMMEHPVQEGPYGKPGNRKSVNPNSGFYNSPLARTQVTQELPSKAYNQWPKISH